MGTGIRSESSGGSRPDVAHLDEDAECLEDPVHCGDAHHQHHAHATSTATAAVPPPPEGDAATTSDETS